MSKNRLLYGDVRARHCTDWAHEGRGRGRLFEFLLERHEENLRLQQFVQQLGREGSTKRLRSHLSLECPKRGGAIVQERNQTGMQGMSHTCHLPYEQLCSRVPWCKPSEGRRHTTTPTALSTAAPQDWLASLRPVPRRSREGGG
jgi:hypothetical protein